MYHQEPQLLVRSVGAILAVLSVLRSRYRLSAEALLQVSFTGFHHIGMVQLNLSRTAAAPHLLISGLSNRMGSADSNRDSRLVQCSQLSSYGRRV